MRRAAQASGTIASSNFSLVGRIGMPSAIGPLTADFEMDGVLQDGGKVSEFGLKVQGDLPGQDAQHSFSAGLDVVAEWGTQTFFRLNGFEIEPEYAAMPTDALQRLTGAWWRVPTTTGPSSTVSPDPRILNAQAEVVKVLRDRGIQRIHGRDAYRYDVTLDPAKLTDFLHRVSQRDGNPFDRAKALSDFQNYSAVGELWMDTKTFYIHKITWDISPSDPLTGASLTLAAELTNHDSAKAVRPPAEYRTYEPGNFLKNAADGSVPLPTLAPVEDDQNLMDFLESADAPLSGSGGELESLLPVE